MKWSFAPQRPAARMVVACAMRRNLSLSQSAHAIAVPNDGLRRASSEVAGSKFCPQAA